MPIYEYGCAECGHQFEALQSFSDPPIEVCAQCGGKSVTKLISKTSFVLKGGGWYKDHYGLKNSSSSSSSSSSAAESSTSKSTDNKSSGGSSSSSDGGK